MSHGLLASPGGVVTTNLTTWRNKIEEDVRKVIIARRPHPPIAGMAGGLSSQGGSLSLSPPQVGGSPLGTTQGGQLYGSQGGVNTDSQIGSQAPPLTPQQRQRAEANRQRALQRQQQKVEEDVAKFMNEAMEEAKKEKEIAKRVLPPGGRDGSQHQQQQQGHQVQHQLQPWQKFL